MKTLFLELNMGAAGDMLSAALFELLSDDKKQAFLEKINSIGVPNVSVSAEKSLKGGISGTHMHVVIDGVEEGCECGHCHEHEHEHKHEHSDVHNHHHHHHSHTSMHDIEDLVFSLKVPAKIKNQIIAIYKIIAEAESIAHGVSVSQIHFHEVGMMDALIDIAGVCLLINEIKPDRIIATPIHVGSGTVHCAHGVMPVPAPATANILKGIPIYSGEVRGELCTPTGAALIKFFATEFSNMPPMSIRDIGIGCGTKDFPGNANILRAILGESNETCPTGRFSEPNDSVVVLTCNMDDMTGEEAGFALSKIFEAGAREAFYEPVFGKKSRPGFKLTVILDADKKNEIIKSIFAHTTTIGIRETTENRYVLDRKVETISTEFGPIRKKISEGFGIKKEKYEYEDLAKIASEKGISIFELKGKLGI